MQLSLLGRVPLLNLRAARFDAFDVVRLAAAGSSAATVAPRVAAHHNNRVACARLAPDDVFASVAAYDIARFETLGFVSVVVNLGDYTRSKPYLIAVTRKPARAVVVSTR